MKQLHLLDALFAKVKDVPRQVVRSRFPGHRHLWDDLEQIACVAVWLALPQIRAAKGKPEQLAFTVAFRAALAEVNRMRIAASREAEAAAEAPSTCETELFPRALVARVSKRNRHLVVRSILMGESTAEIAATRGWSRQAIHRRLRGGIAEMRAAVESEAA